MDQTHLSFVKTANMPTEDLTVGRIYFDDSTATIKVADTTNSYMTYGGIKWYEETPPQVEVAKVDETIIW